MDYCVIAIAREFGSGGHKVGQLVSDRLGIRYYDRELLTLAAEYGGLKEKSFEKYDEKNQNMLLYQINYDGNEHVEKGDSFEDTLYKLQKALILDISRRENAVIVGRNADEILHAENRPVIRVFIGAPVDFRVKRTMKEEGLDEKTVRSLTKKKDRQRRSYCEGRSGKKWGDPANYDLYFDSSKTDFNRIADEIIEEYEKRRGGVE